MRQHLHTVVHLSQSSLLPQTRGSTWALCLWKYVSKAWRINDSVKLDRFMLDTETIQLNEKRTWETKPIYFVWWDINYTFVISLLAKWIIDYISWNCKFLAFMLLIKAVIQFVSRVKHLLTFLLYSYKLVLNNCYEMSMMSSHSTPISTG